MTANQPGSESPRNVIAQDQEIAAKDARETIHEASARDMGRLVLRPAAPKVSELAGQDESEAVRTAYFLPVEGEDGRTIAIFETGLVALLFALPDEESLATFKRIFDRNTQPLQLESAAGSSPEAAEAYILTGANGQNQEATLLSTNQGHHFQIYQAIDAAIEHYLGLREVAANKREVTSELRRRITSLDTPSPS